jgi:hypothetical protein
VGGKVCSHESVGGDRMITDKSTLQGCIEWTKATSKRKLRGEALPVVLVNNNRVLHSNSDIIIIDSILLV